MKLVWLTALVLLAAAGHGQTAPLQLAQAKSCFASDPDGKGANELDNAIRATIRKNFERPPAPGADGQVTVAIQSLLIGPKRAWNTNEIGAFSTGDQTKPIYDVKALFTICTDYRTSINTVQRERLMVCFLDAFGAVSCQVTVGTATPDKNETVQK